MLYQLHSCKWRHAAHRSLLLLNHLTPHPRDHFLPPLDEEQTKAEACEVAYGPGSPRCLNNAAFATEYHHFVSCFNSHYPTFSTFGKMTVRHLVAQFLATNVAFNKFFDEHPEIEQQPLPPILIMAGFARSGTTYFQNLLTATDRFRYFTFADGASPLDVPSGRVRARIGLTVMGYLRPYLSLMYNERIFDLDAAVEDQFPAQSTFGTFRCLQLCTENYDKYVREDWNYQ